MIFHSLLSSPEELQRREASVFKLWLALDDVNVPMSHFCLPFWTTPRCAFNIRCAGGSIAWTRLSCINRMYFAPPRQINPDFLFTASSLHIPRSRRSDVRTAMSHRFGITRVYMRSFQILCPQRRIPSGTSGRAKTKPSNRACTGSLSQRLPVFAVHQPTVTPTRLNIVPSARVQCHNWTHQRDGDSSSSLCRRREDRP